jgi:tetratricopeptide (TPR) repeat protein
LGQVRLDVFLKAGSEIEQFMQYQEYIQRVQQVSILIKKTHLKEAVDALYQLVLSDISEIDKADLCTNLAIVYDRLGNTGEALAWYDKGISYEQNYFGFDVAEKKAQYLSQLGRSDQAIPIYESLLKQPSLREREKERMRKTIQSLLGKPMHGWQ